MKRVFNSGIAAFAMFSRIPMPKADWKQENLVYMLVFMPWVGAVIGGLSWLWGYYGGMLPFQGLACTALLFLIPYLLTGGIHLDGYLDTSDALSAWMPKEKRIEILKDVHVGAFAVLRGSIYLLLMFCLYTELGEEELPFLALMFPVSRALNAISILKFPKAKKEGTVNTWQANAAPICFPLLCITLAVCILLGLWIDPARGCLLWIAAFVAFGLYYRKAMNYFGGMNGDLAGYFVCRCELFILVAQVAWRVIVQLP